MPRPPPKFGSPSCALALVIDDHEAVGDAHLVRMPARRHLDARDAPWGASGPRCRRWSCRSARACGRCRASCRRPTPGRRRGNRYAPRAACSWSVPLLIADAAPSAGLDQSPYRRVVLAVLLIERQRLQRRLVAGHEQDRRVLVGEIDVLAPGAAGNDEGVEAAPSRRA